MENTDTTLNQTQGDIIWEETHPSHNNSDLHAARLYSNGSYHKYSNTILTVDIDSNPVYTKVPYKWREYYILSTDGMDKIAHYIKDNCQKYSINSSTNPPGSKPMSIIRCKIDEIECIIELPNQQYDPDRYAFFTTVNDLIMNNIQEYKELSIK